MKNKIKKWLDKLAATNKESFGSEPLDCCKIGRDKDNKGIINNNKKTQ